MESLVVSSVSVALAEIGDKTQLLALVLAALFRKPWPIIAGILLATLVNHGIAAQLGSWLSGVVSPEALRWAVAASFIAMGLWILVPDKDDDAAAKYPYGAFLTTLIAFFLVEIGGRPTADATDPCGCRQHLRCTRRTSVVQQSSVAMKRWFAAVRSSIVNVMSYASTRATNAGPRASPHRQPP